MNLGQVLLISTVISLSSTQCACNRQGWEPLFNGKDLEGWSVKHIPADQEKEYWKISPEQAPVTALETSLVYFEDDSLAWNDMEIICDGMMVETRVNGNRVSESNGEGILNDEAHQIGKSGET